MYPQSILVVGFMVLYQLVIELYVAVLYSTLVIQ